MGGKKENYIPAREIYKIVLRNHADTERNLFPINYIYVGSFLQIRIMLISAGLYSFHPGPVLLPCYLGEFIPLLQYKTHFWEYHVFPAQTAPGCECFSWYTAVTPFCSDALCFQLNYADTHQRGESCVASG